MKTLAFLCVEAPMVSGYSPLFIFLLYPSNHSLLKEHFMSQKLTHLVYGMYSL